MQYFGFDRPSFQSDYFGFGVALVTDDEIKLVFEGDKQGLFYDPSDLTTLFKDAAGTQPVTADGDPVGLIKDKSGNNNHATQAVSAARLVYRTDGILHWLEQDGVDDYMKTANFGLAQPVSMAFAMSASKNSLLIDGLSNNSGSVSSSGNALRLYAGPSSNSAYYSPLITYDQNHVYDARISGDTSYITFDNNPITIRSVGTANMGGVTIGASASGTVPNEGRFYGMVVVAGEISITNRQAIKQYLATKAGVAL